MNAKPLPPVWVPVIPGDVATPDEHATIIRVDTRLTTLETGVILAHGVVHQETTGYPTASVIVAQCTNARIAVIRRMSGETIIYEQATA